MLHLLYQITESAPSATIDMPMMAPIMLWVVDTGISKKVARASQMPAARRAHNIP